MKNLIHALRAETLKMKRTLAFWLTLIAPAVVVALQTLVTQQRKEYYMSMNLGAEIWFDYGLGTLVLWSLMMLPLFIALEVALIANLEHKSGQWKHLFTLPIPRGTLYAAKQLCGMALVGLSTIALVVWTVLGGWVLRFWVPGLGFETSAPIGEYARFCGFLFLGTWLITAILTWVAQRWSSFAIASAVGVAMTVMGVVVIQSDWAGLYPVTLPILVANGFSDTIQPLNILDEGVRPVKELLMGSVGGILVAIAGGWEVTRRDVL